MSINWDNPIWMIVGIILILFPFVGLYFHKEHIGKGEQVSEKSNIQG